MQAFSRKKYPPIFTHVKCFAHSIFTLSLKPIFS